MTKQTEETTDVQGMEVAKPKNESLMAKFNPEAMTGILDNLDKEIQKGTVDIAEETAEYFDPEIGVEYLCMIESTGTMQTEKDGQKVEVPAVYFYAKERSAKGNAKRYIDASTIVVKTFSQILEKYGAFGCGVSLIHTQIVGNGSNKYKDYEIKSIHSNNG